MPSNSRFPFLATVTALLDVPVEHQVDGRDAKAVFTGAPADKWDDMAFLRGTGRPQGTANAWISAMTQRYKLVYSSIEEPWLIDVKNDPNELTNLFGHPEHKQRTRLMTEKLLAYGETHNDEYVRIPQIRWWMDQVIGRKQYLNRSIVTPIRCSLRVRSC